MCVIIKSTWVACGHRTQRIERCELVSTSTSSSTSATVCPNTTTKTIIQCLQPKRVPPLCPVSTDCMPFDYWSCCKCQHLLGAGSKGGKGHRADKGGLRQKGRTRRARFAPSFNARDAYVMLRHGRVCVGDAFEEDKTLSSIVEVDEPENAESVDIASLSETFEALTLGMDDLEMTDFDPADIDEEMASPSEYGDDSDDDMDDVDNVDDVDDADNTNLSESHEDDGCNHFRCDKCLQWRRCPCGCNCRRIIPATHRRCDKCARSKCREHDPSITVLPVEAEIE